MDYTSHRFFAYFVADFTDDISDNQIITNFLIR